MVRITICEKKQQAEYYIEDLGNNVELAMVKIPGGKFLMGSPENELERVSLESPQHEVTVPEFYMGRYPITQGQWKAVVETTKKIERDLNSDPSFFKDDYENYGRWNRPVEQVSWLDAQEFCARLSQKTGRDYRLPSEAEWEYACRAGTTTPFHFGETITTDLANYCGVDRDIDEIIYSGSYGRGPKGKYREQTTPVGYFKTSNFFGLYDMHGNVLEWCKDERQWHYINRAPGNQNIAEVTTTVIRGGSWTDFPGNCRSAYHDIYNPDDLYNFIGFRVLRISPRTL
ncbi:formylglycine-generating enzyme family protein [Okeania sp. KiyG1]|uniref:formylglycine-generating enzyme family protein n=1 Tax=Okeania sp. KiyG1 TaxID=2720165 RepID=UPI0019225BDE|nr:formylglycine-generating enzyme family protein [Okeania sp. KiyG1]